jgi:hypothetical protein
MTIPKKNLLDTTILLTSFIYCDISNTYGVQNVRVESLAFLRRKREFQASNPEDRLLRVFWLSSVFRGKYQNILKSWLGLSFHIFSNSLFTNDHTIKCYAREVRVTEGVVKQTEDINTNFQEPTPLEAIG